MSFSTISRRESILKILSQQDKVTVEEMIKKFKVSGVTIRKDLDVLETQGHLIKTYGGAMRPQFNSQFFTLEEKSRRYRREKEMIGQHAAALIDDQQCLYLDSGTTVAQIVPFLAKKRDLTIIVNSLKLAVKLGEQHRHHIILLGGELREEHLDTVGDLTPSILKYIANITIVIGADGIHPSTGVMAVDVESSQIVQALLPSALRIIVCADHTKFRLAGHYRVVPLERVNFLVTNRKLSQEYLDSPSMKHIQIIH